MPNTLEEPHWEILLRRIKSGRCTPFIGAGACFGSIPLGRKLASELAKKYNYPLEGPDDLVRVAQYIAVQYDAPFAKEEIQTLLENVTPPDFGEPNEPHGILADLPLPIYITTNYDDFMMQALRSRNRNPRRELCRWWNERVRNQESIFDSGLVPSVADPVVFHLHGYFEVLDSLVLTEDDYIDFLISISEKHDLLPLRIEQAFTETSLLFLGYRFADWDFRVLFRRLASYLTGNRAQVHISVQLLPVGDTVTEEEKEQVQKHFDRYYQRLEIHVYWGSCREFATDLRTRWEAAKSA